MELVLLALQVFKWTIIVLSGSLLFGLACAPLLARSDSDESFYLNGLEHTGPGWEDPSDNIDG